jgi:diaminohydroxyphosphoribosylaminopyrimidine deaminase / 5-amino-6-(5-phosphoribosylamino)uracil reductase
MAGDHDKHMRRALELAERGRGRTSPNPMVGAVIVKDGAVIAEGWHGKAGLPHAEIEALREAGGAARGAAMYVNLEPCAHFGQTPPCAPAVADAGIARVVAGMQDPNPKVAGRGFEILRERGVDVIHGVLENECLKLNEAFVKVMKTGLPFVTLKAAATLDGKIASPNGDSKWISNDASRARVHRLRGEMDAVAVGIGTLLKDNPLLTSRVPEDRKIKDPVRVVFDDALLTPADSNFTRLAADGKSIVIMAAGAPADRKSALERAGCRVLEIESDAAGRPKPESALRALAGRGILSILLEGGGELNFAMLRAGLVDRVLVFVSTRLIGGRNSKTFLEGAGFDTIADAIPLENISVDRSDGDIVIEGDVRKNG